MSTQLSHFSVPHFAVPNFHLLHFRPHPELVVEVDPSGPNKVRLAGRLVLRDQRDIIDLIQLALLAYQRAYNELQ